MKNCNLLTGDYATRRSTCLRQTYPVEPVDGIHNALSSKINIHLKSGEIDTGVYALMKCIYNVTDRLYVFCTFQIDDGRQDWQKTD